MKGWELKVGVSTNLCEIGRQGPLSGSEHHRIEDVEVALAPIAKEMSGVQMTGSLLIGYLERIRTAICGMSFPVYVDRGGIQIVADADTKSLLVELPRTLERWLFGMERPEVYR